MAAAPLILGSGERATIDTHFAGDQALFLSYRESCHRQFIDDLSAGQAAAENGDAAGLRFLAHNLKSVLATLGHAGLGELARELETAASIPDWPTAHGLWSRLRQALQQLAAPATPTA